MATENLYTMKFEEKRKVAQLGNNKGLYEYFFEIDKIGDVDRTDKKVSLFAELEHLNLLPSVTEEHFISIKEASEISGLTTKKIKLMCKRGYLTGITKGRAWFILKQALEDYLKSAKGDTL